MRKKENQDLTANWKPIVEQYFGIINLDRIHFLPGVVRVREQKRGERDYRLDAKLTLDEFTEIIMH